MKRLVSQIDTQSPAFLANQKANQAILEQFRSRLDEARQGGPASAIEKHKSRNKMLARERIDKIIDPGTAFLELGSLAAWGLYDNQFPSAGVVTGIGMIHGRECMMVVNDATVKGGTYNHETVKKHVRAQEVALENNLPCIYMVDSGGAFLPNQANVFPDKNDFGRIFYNQAQMSARSIPQIAIVMGSCTAGGAYVPAMSDETIIVRNNGTIFIGGPPLVKAATGADVSAEELGGAVVHTSISGVADHLAENEEHALSIARGIVSTFKPPSKQRLDFRPPEDPAYDPAELLGLISPDLKKPVDAKEIIARLVDGSRFQEFKENYGLTLTCGFAHILGMPVGILASNGILFPESSRKGAHFIELCVHRKVPILFLQNITGFIVGKDYEHAGIARDGAKLVHAVATATVPKFTLVFGGSFGAGNYAMCGRAYGARMLYMWPWSKISVMGGEQAAHVLTSVKEDALKLAGKEFDAEKKAAYAKEILEKYEEEGSAYYSTARLWDDGIIDPLKTREVLALSISASLNQAFEDPKFGVFRM